MTTAESEIDKRRAFSHRKLGELQTALRRTSLPDLTHACAYAIGSFGRREGSEHSDLDLFILGATRKKDGKDERLFPRLEEIELKAALIQATREVALPPFSGDGEYLRHYPIAELIGNTGGSADDAENTLTARLLLLLESQAILNPSFYDEAKRAVIARYWRDFPSHEKDFVPAYLINDIQRIWRTFCVNYEARTSAEDAAKRAKRDVKNYKLRHSRLLTCFSGLVYLQAISMREGTVTPDDAFAMTERSPVERIEWVAEEFSHVRSCAQHVLDAYEEFLVMSSLGEDELHRRATEAEAPFTKPSNPVLGKAVFELLQELGRGSRFLQLVVV